jgi:hypothetical protein
MPQKFDYRVATKELYISPKHEFSPPCMQDCSSRKACRDTQPLHARLLMHAMLSGTTSLRYCTKCACLTCSSASGGSTRYATAVCKQSCKATRVVLSHQTTQCVGLTYSSACGGSTRCSTGRRCWPYQPQQFNYRAATEQLYISLQDIQCGGLTCSSGSGGSTRYVIAVHIQSCKAARVVLSHQNHAMRRPHLFLWLWWLHQVQHWPPDMPQQLDYRAAPNEL